MPGGGIGRAVTDYEQMLVNVTHGNVRRVRHYISSIRIEHAGKKHLSYDTKRGHLTTHDGTHIPISDEALNHFLEEMVEEAERIHEIIEAKYDIAYRAMWEKFFTLYESRVPEYSRANLEEYAHNTKYKELFGVYFHPTTRAVLKDMLHDAAAFHIEQRNVDWHKAWQDYPWYPNFAALDTDPLDNERALELIEASRNSGRGEAADAIMQQYFSERLDVYTQASLKDGTWAAAVRSETASKIGGRES